MFGKSILVAAIAVAFSSSGGLAFAGPASGASLNFGVSVQQENGSTWTLNMSDLMNFDASTGAFALDASKVASPLNDAQGQWSQMTAGSTDIDGRVLATDRVKWHSWERADGTSGATATESNPWASIFSFTAAANVDPFLSYGFTVKNSSNLAQTYSFSLSESMTPPISGSFALYSDISGALVKRAGAQNASITPVFADMDGDSLAELQVLSLSSNGGLSYVNAGVDVGLADVNTIVGTKLYGQYSAAKTDVGNYDFWSIESKFTLTGNQNVASLAGYAEIVQVTAVPEPEQSGMLLAGLVAIGYIARRRSDFA